MPIKCKDIINIIESFAPEATAESWDNVGLLVGSYDREINKVLVALDATAEVVDEAISIGAELIITHHPVIFKPIAKINDETPNGKKLLKLIENKICVYSLHTNLDAAYGGTNDELANRLELNNITLLNPPKNENSVCLTGRKGTLKNPMSLYEFAGFVKDKLELDGIRFVGDGKSIIKTVGVFTGSGSGMKNFMDAKAVGCDVYVTGDIRFHDAQDALSMGLSVVDATHYASENIIVGKLINVIYDGLNKIGVDIPIIHSKINGQVFITRS